MKNMNLIKKKTISTLIIFLTLVFFTACSSNEETNTTTAASEESASIFLTEEETEAETSKAADETTSLSETTKTQIDETYPETVKAEEAAEDESSYFGIMYATVLSVNTDDEGNETYSFVDKNDSEDSWTFTSFEISAIEAEMTAGADVAVLFNGDIINDSENVSFIAVIPDGNYTIKKAVGTVTENMMSTFALTPVDGEEIYFLKDNCRMDDGALDMDEPKEITVYYADGEDDIRYPLRIYS